MRSIQLATILSGQSLSNAVDLGLDGNLAAIITDSAWDTNEIEVQGSVDGTNYFPVYTSGSQKLEVAAAVASRIYLFDTHFTAGVRYVKFLSTASDVPVNQTGNTVLTVISGHFV
jgi:hypothetical protein